MSFDEVSYIRPDSMPHERSFHSETLPIRAKTYKAQLLRSTVQDPFKISQNVLQKEKKCPTKIRIAMETEVADPYFLFSANCRCAWHRHLTPYHGESRNDITTLALYGHGSETILFFSMGHRKVIQFPIFPIIICFYKHFLCSDILQQSLIC